MNNCPNAHVVLVNYGPANKERVLRGAPDEIADRATVIGEFRPDKRPNLELFAELITEVLEREQDAAQIVHSPFDTWKELPSVDGEAVALIRLTWGDKPRDLDLHLFIKDVNGNRHHVSYNATGTKFGLPWAQYGRDFRNGHGPETITVFKWLPGAYDIFVDNYSDEASLRNSGASVEVFRKGHEKISVACPMIQNGKWWHVLCVDTEAHGIKVVNRFQIDTPL